VKKEKRDNLIIVESYLNLLYVIRSYINDSQKYSIVELMRNFLCVYKKALISISNKEINFIDKGFMLKRNIVYRYLTLIEYSLSQIFKKLSNDYNSGTKPNPFKRKQSVSKDKSFMDFVKYEVETIKTNKFLFLKGEQYKFSENDSVLVSISLKIVLQFIKVSKLYSKINQINKNEFYLDYFLLSSNFLNWFRNILNLHHFNTKIFKIIVEVIYELLSDTYGLQIFNFFKKIDIKQLIKGFNYEAKYLISATFNQRFHYYAIIKKLTELNKPDTLSHCDFITINWNIIIPHLLSTYEILNKNPYFKLPEEVDTTYSSPYLIISKLNPKLFSNKIGIQIQCKFYEILSNLTFKQDFMEIIIKHSSFNKIIERIFFFAMVKIDEVTENIFANYQNLFFLMYSCFIIIVNNLNKFCYLNEFVSKACNGLFPTAKYLLNKRDIVIGLEEKINYFKSEKNNPSFYINILKKL
jgi:hypothetical protein